MTIPSHEVIREAVGEVKSVLKFNEVEDNLTPYGKGLQTLLSIASAYLSGGLKTLEEWTKVEEGDDCAMYCSLVKQLQQESKQFTPATEEGIQKAIEILGRPVMSYAPDVAIGEYDKKVSEAVSVLLPLVGKVAKPLPLCPVHDIPQSSTLEYHPPICTCKPLPLCPRCDGKGIIEYREIDRITRDFKDGFMVCSTCNGTGKLAQGEK